METLGVIAGAWVLVYWFWDRGRQKKIRQAACFHEDTFFLSMDNAGVWWSKHCRDCGYQEPYKRTIPARSHPDNPRCWRGEQGTCECATYCEDEHRG